MLETLTLADLCQPGSPLVLSPDDPVSMAMRLMEERRKSSVVLAIDDRPVGIFTERNALGLIAHGGYAAGTPLRELMSSAPLTASPALTFVEGYARMAAHGFRHLVLVDDQGRLCGVLSETDFAHGLGAEELLVPSTVADLMTRDPVTLPPGASLATALALMAERNISSVVIVEDERAVGILSERDAIPLAGADLDLPTTPLGARMSHPVHTIGPDRPAHEASPLMRALGVRRLVVEDAAGRLVGILTRRDLVKDIQDVYLRLLRRTVVEQGRALQDARRQLSEQTVLRSLLEHSEDLGVIAADAEQGIHFINTAALQALGLTDAVARSLPLSGLLTAAGLEAEGYAERLATLAGAERLTLDLSRAAGERWLRLVASAIRDTAGQREGYLLTIQDRLQEYPADEEEVGPVAASPELTLAARRRAQLERELRYALAADEFRLLYQPIVTIDTGSLVAVEALVRWQHPRAGLLLPRDFIDTVEHSDLDHRLGHWVLEQAVAQARTWLAHGRVRVSINVSGPQLAAGGLVRDLQEILERTGLDPSLLGIEVQERVLLRTPDRAPEQLKRLHDLGISIALDDVGAGYSSLHYLKSLPIDYLKIGRGFVRHMTTDPADEASVRSSIALAHELGIKVIAVGVETADQLNDLGRAGCDLVQGFLLGRPVEAEAITRLVVGRA